MNVDKPKLVATLLLLILFQAGSDGKETPPTLPVQVGSFEQQVHVGYTQADGLPTRWGNFSPDKLNRDPFWWEERGLKSLSILAYLAVTHHITGDQKYRDAFLELAWEHGYAMNGLTQPKAMLSPGAFGQGDDDMAFLNYYHLLRYETDPALQDMFNYAVY